MSILKAIEKLVKAGYPESTAKKIASGELDMSLSARNARMREQGYDPAVTYHHGPTGIREFKDPETDRFLKLGRGIYSSTDPEYGAKYAAQHGLDETAVYPLVTRGNIASWKDVSEAQKRMILDPNYKWMGHNSEWEWVQQDLKNQGFSGADALGERVSFSANDLRDAERAAFDPDNIGKPNILGSAAPVAAAGVLGALGLPQDATAADIALAERPDLSPEGKKEVQQMILDAILGFMAPQPLGDATMDAYNRNRIR